jgi:hypothetical protein
MLAVMPSLASSVFGATALTPSLLAFYATAATVIPVLFIVLVVQGTTYQAMIGAIRNMFRRVRVSPPRSRSRVLAGAGAGGLFLAAYAVVLAGGLGDLLAIYALFRGYDRLYSRVIVLVLTGILIFLVTAGPLRDLARSARRDPGGQETGEAVPPVGPAAPSVRAERDPDEADTGSV